MDWFEPSINKPSTTIELTIIIDEKSSIRSTKRLERCEESRGITQLEQALTKLLKGAPDSETLHQASRRDGGARPYPLICDDLDIIEALKLIGK